VRRALAWLAGQDERIVSQRDIHNGPLGRHGKAEHAAELAQQLVDAGALRRAGPSDPTGGRPAGPRFEINPRLRQFGRADDVDALVRSGI
jgi:hypothetical protein